MDSMDAGLVLNLEIHLLLTVKERGEMIILGLSPASPLICMA